MQLGPHVLPLGGATIFALVISPETAQYVVVLVFGSAALAVFGIRSSQKQEAEKTRTREEERIKKRPRKGAEAEGGAAGTAPK